MSKGVTQLSFPWEHPALAQGIITYIGNKRSLIPFIAKALDQIDAEIGGIQTIADPFTGSGVVARLCRLRGARVAAGDLEAYTRPFGKTFLEVQPDEVDSLFAATGGYDKTRSYLNSLTHPAREEDLLFSRHYAPEETKTADPERERMFFTRENALRIDAMLAAIHRDLPVQPLGKEILLAGLLVEMSIHNNTSGVMKGFHHGWGGRGADALSRIMAPLFLDELPFIHGPRGFAFVGPAEELSQAAQEAMNINSFDVVYVDPPYNIHQYGANYHLLTTAVQWDFYDPGPVQKGTRAGIRRDHNRSAFCSRQKDRAKHAFERFLQTVSAQALLVSYNNDGIIDPTTMTNILSEDGLNTVSLMVQEHHKFRGGKSTQSALRTDEYLFVVYRGRRQSHRHRQELYRYIDELMLKRELADRVILPSRWEAPGRSVSYNAASPGWTLTGPDGTQIELSSDLRVRTVSLTSDDDETLGGWHDVIKIARESSGSMVEIVEELIRKEMYDLAITQLQRLKIKKYREDFRRLAQIVHHQSLTDSQKRRLTNLYRRVTGHTIDDA